MGSYAHWRTAVDRGDLRRVTWVCGDQPVLVEEVVEQTRQLVAAEDLDYLSFTVGADPEPVIWAAAHQYPLIPGASRLICVREAHRLRRWDQLESWLSASRQLTTSFLLFVAAQPDPPEGKPGELLRGKARIVRCAMPNEADTITWLRQRAPNLEPEVARHLIQRVGGDLAQAAAVADKLTLFAGSPNPATINALCDRQPGDSLVDSLLALDKPAALQAAATLSFKELTKTFALLDSRLDMMAALWRASRVQLNPREIRDYPAYLVRRYLPDAKHYDPHRCVYSRRVLAVCEEALKSGATTGLVEALIALW